MRKKEKSEIVKVRMTKREITMAFRRAHDGLRRSAEKEKQESVEQGCSSAVTETVLQESPVIAWGRENEGAGTAMRHNHLGRKTG